MTMLRFLNRLKFFVTLISLVSVFAPSIATVAHAQSTSFYKDKTIRIIVGFTSGGLYDQYARILARHMGKHIPGNPKIIVQNMPGAGSLSATNYVFGNVKPDGLTLGMPGSANATTTSAAEEETEDTEEGTETTAAAQDGDCAPGSYAIEDGDNPTLIAEKFDVTLEALTAANGWDASYSNFPGTGESIVIPAPADCDATATT